MKKILKNMNRSGIKKLFRLLKSRINLWYHLNFNLLVKSQIKDPKSIPIIIISFNQLYYLKQLIDYLLKNSFGNIIVLDNKSTFEPLLLYLEKIQDQVKVVRKNENLGHLSFWKNRDVFKKYSKGYYVVTDADIVPIDECPDDLIKKLLDLLNKAYDRTKIGLSLKIDDIPDSNPNKSNILTWEQRYWTSRIETDVYKAEIDTTFALYRPGYDYKLKDFTKAWRTDHPYQACHGGWYIDIQNLTDEQDYYMRTANESASWQIDEKGELINKIHNPLYTDNE